MVNVPDAIILCGGAGLRLKSVTGDEPKVMARIGGRPFLELLLRQLLRNSFRRVVLAVGYGKETICSHFGNAFLGLHLLYSDESSPLGTGGALRKASSLLESDSATVLNGDSYADANLCELVTRHYASHADGSILVVRADGRKDCGSVLVDQDGWIHTFQEKVAAYQSAYLNAGIYVLSKALLRRIPDAVQISIEHQLFPQWLAEDKKIQAVVCSAECIDIGTPERYQMARILLANAESNTTAAV